MPKTILIVEDNTRNMKMFDALLQAAGYSVVQAVDGHSGFNAAKEYRPDLIIMDIQLPDISGLEVTAMIKELDDLSHIPIIAVTAFAMKGDREKMLDGGCDDYIAKPITVVTFLETVAKYLS